MYRKLFLSLAVLVGLTAAASAETFTHGGITVENPWARASAGQAPNGAAFMSIHAAHDADRLVSASAPVAKKTELHTHLMENGVMKMRQVQGIDVDPSAPTVLQPGGLHVMFMGLNAPLKEGESFPLTLTFEKAGEMTVQVPVMGPGAMGHQGMQTQHQMQMKHGN